MKNFQILGVIVALSAVFIGYVVVSKGFDSSKKLGK